MATSSISIGLARNQTGDRESHRDAVIAVAVDAAAAHRAALDAHPIGQQFAFDAERGKARGHDREPVALLHAQLRGAGHDASRRWPQPPQ